MSNTLRRPMFRGGPVDSRGTGITSGLDDGYMGGGQIGGGTIAGNLMPDGRYGFQNPRLIDLGGGRPTPTTSNVAGLSTKLLPQSFLDIMESYGKKARPAFNLLKGSAIPLTIAGAPFYMDKDPLQGKPAEEEFQTTAEELQQQYYGQPRRKLMEDITSGTRSKAESPYTGFDMDAANRAARSAEQRYFLEKKGQTPLQLSTEEDLGFATGLPSERKKVLPPPPSLTTSNELTEEDLDEQQIKRESKLYEKLLGGEEARSQSVYDALLAAAPGFFKGRNLREAIPQVLESINKSGAFDKPRDIRQAAAQLAIQRRIAVETARAKSDDQLTRLEKQLSAKDTVLNKIGRIPGIQKGDYAGSLPKLPTTQELSSLSPDKYYSVGNDIYLTIGKTIKDPKSGKLIKETVNFSKLG